jgi:subtilisin family serine protease
MLTLEAFDSTDLARIGKAARGLGFEVIATDKRARLLTLQSEGTPKQQRDSARALSAVHGVRYIRHRVVPRTCNNVATGVMGNKYVAASSNGLKLAGRGEVIAVCDTGLDSGDPENIHPDFAGRVRAVKSYPITPDWNAYVTNPGANDGPADLDSGHGTHVAGSVLGDGSASAALEQPIQGHAPKAMLVFQAVEQEMKWKPSAPADLRSERYALAGLPVNLMPLFRYAYDQGARIHSNSWGGGDPGAYDDQCAQFDEFVWKHKDMCFVIAAGNDGTDDDGDGRVNPGSVSSPGTAKNCITVGACENLRPEFNAERYGDWWPEDFPTAPYKIDPMANDSNQIVPFSSRGPTTDGRFKPDVVAPGTFILSTRSTQLAPNNFAWAALPGNKLYFHMGGTSMATPLTSGAVALIREYLRTKRQMTSPSAALLKAVIVAGAERLPKTAPTGTVLDNDQGFGRVNLDRSLKSLLMVLEGAGLKTGQQASATVRVTAANKTLRIALAYSDYPGKGLVNNLNLIVTSPSGKRYVGNQRSSSTGPLAMDAKNNVELVQVAKAAKGTWTIEIVASNVMRGPQDYALAAAQV